MTIHITGKKYFLYSVHYSLFILAVLTTICGSIRSLLCITGLTTG